MIRLVRGNELLHKFNWKGDNYKNKTYFTFSFSEMVWLNLYCLKSFDPWLFADSIK